MEVVGAEESAVEDAVQKGSRTSDDDGLALKVHIKEEVMDEAYSHSEQTVTASLPACLPTELEASQDSSTTFDFDPDVVASMKIELDVAEEPEVESREPDSWREESRHNSVFHQQDGAVMDTVTEAGVAHTCPHLSRTDTDMPTAAARESNVIAVFACNREAEDCIGHGLQCESSVRGMVLQGWESDHEPWCVIKTEPMSESESEADMDTVTGYIAENGARAVFNHDKGGRSNLEVFIGLRNGERRYFCPEAGCGKSYKRGEHLKIHALVHTGDRPYQCPESSCGKSFAHPFVLKEHIRTHTDEKPFQCTESDCGRCFRDRSNFRKHQQMHAGEAPVRRRRPPKQPLKKPYVCPEPGCDRAFSRPSVLQDHLKRHIGEKPYRCTEPGCGSAFLKKAALIMHVRIHTGERPFTCTEPGCGRSFARKNHLKDHMVLHTGKKPFCCTVPGCHRSFTQKIQLSYHMRTHTGEKPYQCPEVGCTKSYTQNKHLRYHMRSHSGSQPFPCPEPGCKRSFDRPSLLAKHSRTHHSKNGVSLVSHCRDNNAENLECKEESR
ncbi:uncharacterized protein LOC143278050 [Babylonia areolata]|uniref:uncharacterized protein LOC143278050 n=1 Tax=Babylonia areolata TaxID=304850 RepID=UPI003FD62CFD